MPLKDPEKRREYNRKYAVMYRKRRPEYCKRHNKAWRYRNWGKHLATAARYRENHPDRVKETNHRSEDKRRGTRNEYKYEYGKRNAAKKRLWDAKAGLKRKLLISVNGGTCTTQQWVSRCEYYGWKCAYCSAPLTRHTVEIDHVIPVADGGSGWASNLVPACRSCNAKKHTKRWLPARLRKFKES